MYETLNTFLKNMPTSLPKLLISNYCQCLRSNENRRHLIEREIRQENKPFLHLEKARQDFIKFQLLAVNSFDIANTECFKPHRQIENPSPKLSRGAVLSNLIFSSHFDRYLDWYRVQK